MRLLWRSRKNPAYRKRWSERLGFCPFRFDRCIWVHAVSVGETIAAIPLIKALKTQYPDIPLVVTNMTITGGLRVKAAFGETVHQCYIPYDLPDAMGRFLDRLHPMIAVIMETELWPNMIAACKARSIPIVLANARLSEKSAKGYRMISSLTTEMLESITMLASQGHADADRFIELGIPTQHVMITGNMKFDLELPLDLFAKSDRLREMLGKERFIWVAASTHPTEEEIILKAHQQLQKTIPEALLILVPRHPERFDAVADLVKQTGFHFARRSRNEHCAKDTNVYLGDSMGEMMLMYAVSDVAFVAGSFAKIGGHNMLEPAVLGKPVITGPHLFNFMEISDMLLSRQGMVKVENAEELAETLSRFYHEKEFRKRVGDQAYKVVEANRGALAKQLEIIYRVMNR